MSKIYTTVKEDFEDLQEIKRLLDEDYTSTYRFTIQEHTFMIRCIIEYLIKTNVEPAKEDK